MKRDPAAARATTATIARVAAVAGVSRATVSRVMNGSPTVAPELASRVRAAAEELRYEPSLVARSLALGRTNTVSLVVPDLANPMFSDVLKGLSHAAAAAGVRVLVAETDENAAEEAILAVEARRRSDGLVLASPRLPEARLRELGERLAPLVLINREIPGGTAPALSVDYAAGMRAVVAHLRELGHRHVCYLSGPPASVSNVDRRHALHATAGLRVTELPCGATFEHGYGSARAAAATGATAIVAYNDMVAVGALAGLREAGLRVPQDLSVTGFDDAPFARYTDPPLTTASIPRHELGRQAWDRLCGLLAGGPPGHNVHFQPRLLVRGSTGTVTHT